MECTVDEAKTRKWQVRFVYFDDVETNWGHLTLDTDCQVGGQVMTFLPENDVWLLSCSRYQYEKNRQKSNGVDQSLHVWWSFVVFRAFHWSDWIQKNRTILLYQWMVNLGRTAALMSVGGTHATPIIVFSASFVLSNRKIHPASANDEPKKWDLPFSWEVSCNRYSKRRNVFFNGSEQRSLRSDSQNIINATRGQGNSCPAQVHHPLQATGIMLRSSVRIFHSAHTEGFWETRTDTCIHML